MNDATKAYGPSHESAKPHTVHPITYHIPTPDTSTLISPPTAFVLRAPMLVQPTYSTRLIAHPPRTPRHYAQHSSAVTYGGFAPAAHLPPQRLQPPASAPRILTCISGQMDRSVWHASTSTRTSIHAGTFQPSFTTSGPPLTAATTPSPILVETDPMLLPSDELSDASHEPAPALSFQPLSLLFPPPLSASPARARGRCA